MKIMPYGVCVNFSPPGLPNHLKWEFFHIKNEMKLYWRIGMAKIKRGMVK